MGYLFLDARSVTELREGTDTAPWHGIYAATASGGYASICKRPNVIAYRFVLSRAEFRLSSPTGLKAQDHPGHSAMCAPPN